MSLFQSLVTRWTGKPCNEDLSAQIALANWTDVWSRLGDQVWQMSRHERRGYIRARAALVVKRSVEQTIRLRQLRADLVPRLYTLTMDSITQRVVEHMSASLPKLPLVRRRAA